MNSGTRTSAQRRAARVACGGAVLLAVTGLSGGAWARGGAPTSAHRAVTASAPNCLARNTQVWLGLGLGGGTAGSTFYPLEFSNVGHNACTLTGYPGVAASGSNGMQVGPAASRMTRPTAR
jgi:hypothetical protein